jgi:hypothetical protein
VKAVLFALLFPLAVSGQTHPAIVANANAATATSASDAFNRADGTLGANWTHETGFSEGGGTLAISGNQLTVGAPTHADAYYYWNANTFTGDQFSQLTLVDVGNVAGPTYWWSGTPVRLTAGSHCYLGSSFSSTDTEIYQVDTVAATAILSDVAATWSAGDVLRTDVHGTSPARIYISRNGLCVNEWLDFSFNYSGGQPGVGGLILNNTYTTPHMDGWSGGNLATPTSVSDSFNRADSLPGVNWTCNSITDYRGGGSASDGLRISSNKLAPATSSAWCSALWSWTQPVDHFAQVTLGAMGASDGEGVSLRASLLSSGNTYYLIFVVGATPATHVQSYSWDGSFHQLQDSTATTWSAGDVFRVEATGSDPVVLTIKKNGSTVTTVSDSTYKFAGTYLGPAIYRASGTPTLDDFSGGSL